MSAEKSTKERTCPGETYTISRAICRTRQRNQYPKCLLCPHRSPDLTGSMVTDPKVTSGIFRPTGVLGRVPDEINEYVVRKVGLAAAQYLRSESPSGSRLAVGCDLRDNSRGFTRILCEGAGRGGMDTLNLGAVAPELLAFVLGTDSFAGAAFVGGGNYAPEINGIRLWRADAVPVGAGTGLEKVGMIARRLSTGCSRLPGESSSSNPMPEYVAYVRKFAPTLGPLTVALHAGGGVAARLFRDVFGGLPVTIDFVPDDAAGQGRLLGKRFPASTAVEATRAAVADSGADLGVVVDFGCECIAFLDEKGDLLGHDVASGLIAAELLTRTPGACVVYDLRATAALRALIEQAEGVPVAAPATPLAFARHFRRNEAVYGADATGLHYFKDFFRFPSPVLALLVLCSHLSRRKEPVSELTAGLRRFSRSGEIAIPIADPEMGEGILARVRDEFPDAEREMIDGVTVRTSGWWFNLRQPGKSAELRLNVEGRTPRDLRRGRQVVERLVSRMASGR